MLCQSTVARLEQRRIDVDLSQCGPPGDLLYAKMLRTYAKANITHESLGKCITLTQMWVDQLKEHRAESTSPNVLNQMMRMMVRMSSRMRRGGLVLFDMIIALDILPNAETLIIVTSLNVIETGCVRLIELSKSFKVAYWIQNKLLFDEANKRRISNHVQSLFARYVP